MAGNKASDLFVRCLEKEGVGRIFGLPGEENDEFMLSLADSSIDFVLTRHEQGAAFMADVHGRLTGEAGVCLATLGPGATNLVTGVADANLDRAPVVALTGQADSLRLHKESHQNMDVHEMYGPLTKWSWSLRNPSNVPEVVRKAFKLATTEKPGACHIELPEDVAGMPADTEPIEPQRLRRPVPADKIVDQAFEAILAAKRPILLAGNGAIRRRASRQLRRFVEATGIGVLSTFMAKGCVAREDPRCLFTVGLQSRDVNLVPIEAADLVITLGYDMVEYHPRLWNPGADKRIVHIDFLPAEVDHCYQCDDPNTCLIPNGFCSMGFALPGAIAAKLVHPERRVLAICGDGGFLMNVQEMETATRLGTDIVCLVWEDGSYGLIEWKQQNQHGRHVSLGFGNPDWVKLAESFGWAGQRIDRSRDLGAALERAFTAGRPALVVIPIDYRENALLSERLGSLVQRI